MRDIIKKEECDVIFASKFSPNKKKKKKKKDAQKINASAVKN